MMVAAGWPEGTAVYLLVFFSLGQTGFWAFLSSWTLLTNLAIAYVL